jgi:tRNA nucleotidyltransferase (CCA-adding enzyme)
MPCAPLKSVLVEADLRLLRDLGAAAQRRGTKLWLVGGPVRDALLGRPVVDLDLTSEAPADKLGAALAGEHGGEVIAESQFGTVKLRFGQRTLDLATARTESYARPGALPTVTFSDVHSDLARRDFSINAMAASLSGDDFGEVLDSQGGLVDLSQSRVRVLHGGSFADDPTRMLRAVRYTTRLGFRMDRRTATLLRRDLRVLGLVSSSRVHREVDRMLHEPLALKMLLASERYGLLGALDSSLSGAALRQALLRATRAPLGPRVLLGVLTYHGDMASLTKKFGFTRAEKRLGSHVRHLHDIESAIAGANHTEIARILGTASREANEACSVASPDPSVRRALRWYLAQVQREPLLSGREILKLGVPLGARVGELLSALRHAQLLGRVRGRSGAVAFIRRAITEG